MGVNEQLGELHDSYVWEVNAAVAADRLDLVQELCDDFLEQSVALLAAVGPGGCGREDCAVCHGSRRPRATPGRRRWPRRRPETAA